MNVQVFLLVTGTALFAAAWSNDRPGENLAGQQRLFGHVPSRCVELSPGTSAHRRADDRIAGRRATASSLVPPCLDGTNRQVVSSVSAKDLAGWILLDCEAGARHQQTTSATAPDGTSGFRCYDLPASANLADVRQESLRQRRPRHFAAAANTPTGTARSGYVSIQPNDADEADTDDFIPMDSLWMFGGCDIEPPAGLPPGHYRVVSSAGDVRTVQFTADDLAYFDVVSDLFARDVYRVDANGRLWCFISIEPPQVAGRAMSRHPE